MKSKSFIIKQSKMNNQAEFMKRVYKLSVWLVKRYNINTENVDFDYGWVGNQKINGLITIKLIFNEKTNN